MDKGKEPLILFHFDAYDPARRTMVRGGWWARSSEQAYYWLEKQGYTDLQLRPLPGEQARLRVRDSALVVFYRQMAVMFASGVPLTDALHLASFSEDRNLVSVCLHLCEQLRTGRPLSQATRLFPSVFGPVVSGLIAAAERSGQLAHTLTRLAEVEERRYKLKREIVSAVTYPALLCGATLALSLLFLLYIFPINEELFASMRLELPLLNRWIGYLVDLLTSPFMPVLLLALGGALVTAWRVPERRRKLLRHLYKAVLVIPPVRRLADQARSFDMLEILGLLLEGGGTVDAALKSMIEATSDPVSQEIISHVRKRIISGDDFPQALAASGFFPPLVCSLLEVGHETGALVEMVRKAAQICEEDVRLALDTATSLLEPLLLAVAGGIAGLAVITSALPMITLLQRL